MCQAQVSAVKKEVTSLQSLYSAIYVNADNTAITGTASDYATVYNYAYTAVSNAKNASNNFDEAGGKLPPNGGYWHDDLGKLLNLELPDKLHTLISTPTTADQAIVSARNALTVDQSNANIVASMHC